MNPTTTPTAADRDLEAYNAAQVSLLAARQAARRAEAMLRDANEAVTAAENLANIMANLMRARS